MFGIAVQDIHREYFHDRLDRFLEALIVFEPEDNGKNKKLTVIGELKLIEVQYFDDPKFRWNFIIGFETPMQWYIFQMICKPSIMRAFRQYGCIRSVNAKFDLNYKAFDNVARFSTASDEKFTMEENEAFKRFMEETETKFTNVEGHHGLFTIIEVSSELHSEVIDEPDGFINGMMASENFEKVTSFLSL